MSLPLLSLLLSLLSPFSLPAAFIPGRSCPSRRLVLMQSMEYSAPLMWLALAHIMMIEEDEFPSNKCISWQEFMQRPSLSLVWWLNLNSTRFNKQKQWIWKNIGVLLVLFKTIWLQVGSQAHDQTHFTVVIYPLLNTYQRISVSQVTWLQLKSPLG